MSVILFVLAPKLVRLGRLQRTHDVRDDKNVL